MTPEQKKCRAIRFFNGLLPASRIFNARGRTALYHMTTHQKLTDAFPLLAVAALLLALSPLFAHATTVGEVIDDLQGWDRDMEILVQKPDGGTADFRIIKDFWERIIISPVANVPTPQPQPDPQPQPGPTTDKLAGHGLMQGGNRNNALSDAQFKHPKISFLVFRDRWSKQEVTNDVFNFTYNAGQIRRARKIGKPFVIGVMAGVGGIPSHVYGNGPAVPWNPNIPAEWVKFINALANSEVDGVKVKDDPLLAAVWIGPLGEPSQEGHLNGIDSKPGYSAAAMLSVIKQCGDATIAAFPRPAVKVIYSVSGQKPVQAYQPQALAHFKAKLGKDRLRIQHNSLGTQTTVTATHHQILLGLHKEGYKVGAEMVQPGQTAGLSKFPERSYAVLYPGDESRLP